MGFDFKYIKSIEFGVSLESKEGEIYRLLPAASEVQSALKEMLFATYESLFTGIEIPAYSPAEKYAANESLRLPLVSEMVAKHRVVYEATNLPTDASSLNDVTRLISYFAIFTDHQKRKLMAFRRASQFKGVLSKKLISFSDDALRILPDRVFKLDNDFDFLIFDQTVFIWRPSGFEFTSDLDQHVAACAVDNISRVSGDLSCVEFRGLTDFIMGHKRAMRLVAAIKSRNDLDRISFKNLRAECTASGIRLEKRDGKLFPAEGSEFAFLMLLDRRRYTVELIEKEPETYEAPSRHTAARADGHD